MQDYRVRSRTACEIAMINPDRFNEAVHAGHYPCAPSTSPGATRYFEISDMIALCVYGRLLKLGFSPAVAGDQACDLRMLLTRRPEINRAVQVTPFVPGPVWKAHDEFDAESTRMGGYEIISVCEWRLDVYRRWVSEKLEEEARTIGRD